ncbi:MAG: hydroxyacid dehydrogenase [Proteobacteria bacterium]|nr:hydroxyacid dehydrogenase [Pseudomonadota bacterium]
MASRIQPVRIFLTHSPDMLANYYGERALAALRAVAEVRVNPNGHVLTTPELVEAARGCDIVISDRQTPGEAAVFDSLPDLIVFERVAVDIRNIDVAAASRNGVLVTQASPGFVAAVTEWIVGAMIAAARHTVDYAAAYHRGEEAEPVMGQQLHGRTLGVIGYGAIGSRLCELGLALGMRVLVEDPYRTAAPALVAVGLPTLLAESDFVVPLAVATAETENMINESALARMKPTAWLINASRGNLVDEAALERALEARLIAGAAMDVGRAPDQKPSPHLARRANVIAAPHIAGLTPQAIEHQAIETARQAAALLKGEIPPGAVNADKATRLGRLRR